MVTILEAVAVVTILEAVSVVTILEAVHAPVVSEENWSSLCRDRGKGPLKRPLNGGSEFLARGQIDRMCAVLEQPRHQHKELNLRNDAGFVFKPFNWCTNTNTRN